MSSSFEVDERGAAMRNARRCFWGAQPHGGVGIRSQEPMHRAVAGAARLRPGAPARERGPARAGGAPRHHQPAQLRKTVSQK